MKSLAIIFATAITAVAAESRFFEIQAIDDQTGRGVPLVELETVNHLKFLTDSAGRVAIAEPAFENQTVFFHVRSHGYEFPKDGFGMRGSRLKVTLGGKEILKVKRLNVAERLYRNTGEGIYRDSMLLGYKVALTNPQLNAQVLGQDSIQRVIYKGQIHWFWGDTLRLGYPLGNFRMSGAVSELPSNGGLPPEAGVNLRYFTNQDGFCKGMFPMEPKGDLIWADGFLVVPDGSGRDRMLAHYQRLKGLSAPLARGLAIYNDVQDEFEKVIDLELAEKWRFPHGHPLTITNDSQKQFYFGLAFPNVRVDANTNALLQPAAYEAFSCLKENSETELNQNESGEVIYRWTKNAAPATPKLEADLIKVGKLKSDEAHFQPRDIETGSAVLIHSGTVNWNPWRKRWILLAVQQFGTSMLGEIWYGEADAPTGPWRHVVKVVTHDRYSFYNPAHHRFFDQEGGRRIYFEGTYTADFSGNPTHTPRYDYNQIMYRLDLSDPRLKGVQ
jgi:hypothetical protein